MSKALKEDRTLSGMDRYIRALYSATEFPLVDENGCLYLSLQGKTGRAAANSRKPLFDGTPALANHMRLHFPQGALHTVPSPKYWALEWRPDPVQPTVTSMFKSEVKLVGWSTEEMALAAKAFEVPANTQILLMFPEILDCEILLKDPKFQFH
jgi:hypothetical protein